MSDWLQSYIIFLYPQTNFYEFITNASFLNGNNVAREVISPDFSSSI
jgi:hypothetical protein